MKKKFLLLVALFASIGLANAQTLTVPEIHILQGGKASFGLIVDVPANSYAGFQFETNFPTGINYTGKTTVATSDWDASSFSTSDVNFNGSASSSNLTPIPAGKSLIASAEIIADGGMAPGEYTITISNFEFLKYAGGVATEDKKIDPVTFKVTVVSGVDVVLDENSPIAPETTASAVDIKVFRTIGANEWSTICLPFPMSATKWTAAFGDDAEIRPFNGYEKVGNALNVKLGNKLTAAMKTGTPYFIKTTNDVTDFTVNATINRTAGEKTSFKIEDEETGEEVETCYLQGIFVAGTKLPAKTLFLNDNKFYYSIGKTMSKGFRAYFWLKDVLDSYSSAPEMITFVIDDNDSGNTTGISSVKNGKQNGAYYNLNGQHVENPAKGLYIKNGKKVIVK